MCRNRARPCSYRDGIDEKELSGKAGKPAMRYPEGESMMMPGAITKQPQINAAVTQVIKELSPGVQRTRYEIAPDWSGQWAIFFRVLLADEASKDDHLREIVPRVVWRLSEQLDLPNLGLFPYFDFRSQSEQTQLDEPAW